MAKKKPDKLAQDVSKAIAAGMSYGKWKAMQPPVTAEKELPEGWKICPQCGKWFKAKQGKRFCEDACRKQAYENRQKEMQSQYYKRKRGLKQ